MAEDEGVDISITVRWIGHLTDIKAKVARGEVTASPVTFAMRGETNGIPILGRYYRVEEYLEARPGASCKAHGRWDTSRRCAPSWATPDVCLARSATETTSTPTRSPTAKQRMALPACMSYRSALTARARAGPGPLGVLGGGGAAGV